MGGNSRRRKVVATVYLDQYQDSGLRALSEVTGRPVAEFVREAIDAVLQLHGQEVAVEDPKNLYWYKAELVRVVDGDTLCLRVDLGFDVWLHIRARLWNVDTPEVFGIRKGSEEHMRGIAASDFTRKWFDSNGDRLLIRTHEDTREKYGRWLVEVYPPCGEGVSLNEAIALAGHTKASPVQ